MQRGENYKIVNYLVLHSMYVCKQYIQQLIGTVIAAKVLKAHAQKQYMYLYVCMIIITTGVGLGKWYNAMISLYS